MKEIHHIQDAKYTNSLRRDLLGANPNDAGGLRKRGANAGSEDMSQAMKHHANMQEKIAEDMLALTRNLREQTETANRIIKRDTDVRRTDRHILGILSMSSLLTDRSSQNQPNYRK